MSQETGRENTGAAGTDGGRTGVERRRPDPRRRLDAAEVRASQPPGWAQITGSLKARFHTPDFATGLRLANLIGESAERWDHHPDVNITYRDVVVTLVSHDVGGITSRDLRMARLIGEHAAALGLSHDVSGLTQLEPGLDTSNGAAVAPFYAALLGTELTRGEPADPSGQTPTLWWQEAPEGEEENRAALPPSDHEQRWHFDVWVAEEEGPARVQAALEAGGRLVSEAQAPSYWVLEDPDGNRHCVCTPSAR